jgi:hypothetical protein
MINRAVLIVRPRQPFLDWAAQLDASGLVPDATGEQTAYLVPEFEDDAGAQRMLKRIFAEVFERELFGWNTDESAWPKVRTFAVFQRWFQVELHSVTEDPCDYEIVDDEA